MLTRQHGLRLAQENQQFSGTGGVSENNAHARFAPASFHMLEGLPEEWVVERDVKGRVVTVKTSIVSGFIRMGQFFTWQEAADFIEQIEAGMA
jgi:hypothetical protein